MIYNKNNLLVAMVADTKARREELTGVYFKSDRTVATDSYKLIEVKNPPEFKTLINDYPKLNAQDKVLKGMNKKGYIIPVKTINKVLKNLSEVKSKYLPVLLNAVFLTGSDDKTSRIATTDLDKTDIIASNNIQGDFPDYEKLKSDTNKNHVKILISVNQLKPVLDTLDKMNLTGDKQIELYINQTIDKPLIIKAKTIEEQDVTALVMPLKM